MSRLACVTLILLLATAPQVIAQTSQPAARIVDPLAGLDSMIERLDPKHAEDAQTLARIAQSAEGFRKQLADGFKPPWLSGIKETEDQLRAMKTAELGPILFKSGVAARESLIYDNPQTGMTRLDIMYPGFHEFFSREDIAAGFVAILEEHARQTTNADSITYVQGMMGLTTLPNFYAYPPIRKHLVGHEKELIAAHVAVLKQLDAQLTRRAKAPDPARPAFFATAPASLVTIALALGNYAAPEHFPASREALSHFTWTQDGPSQDLQPFVKKAIEELTLLSQKETK